MLDEAGYPLNGWEGVIASNIPVGAGLSSSAALELAAHTRFCRCRRMGMGTQKDGPFGPES